MNCLFLTIASVLVLGFVLRAVAVVGDTAEFIRFMARLQPGESAGDVFSRWVLFFLGWAGLLFGVILFIFALSPGPSGRIAGLPGWTMCLIALAIAFVSGLLTLRVVPDHPTRGQ